MSKDFYKLNNYEREMYELTINGMLLDIYESNLFTDTIRNLCHQALINEWTLDKKINIINIVNN